LVASCAGISADLAPTVDTATPPSVSSPFFDGKTAELVVEDSSLLVAVADDSEERAQGLSEVPHLSGLDGMLFLFEEPRTLQFNMRDTHFPLDLWFVDESGVIVENLEMEPCPAEPCPLYPSEREVAGALETPLGQFDFNVGDVVTWHISP
jgi:uncharacterized membrane protein (UPF0127 family)